MRILVTGGARSGKSGFAERYAACLGSKGIYIATSCVWDEEMQERVSRHKSQRETAEFHWKTIEEPLLLADTLQILADSSDSSVVLVDCLTLWLTNIMMELQIEDWTEEARLEAARTANDAIGSLLAALDKLQNPVILVTNEVGCGIVPEYPLGRLFRDLSGQMNQRLAAVSHQVILVTAGIAVDVKRIAFQLPSPYDGV